MRYVSTRGESEPASFNDILLTGLAPDGGLYVPERYPQLNLNLLREVAGDYRAIALRVLREFMPEYSMPTLTDILARTYNAENFGTEEIVPVRMLARDIGLLKLSEGPTLAFKDLALQLLGNLMEHRLEHTRAVSNILGATSGDTGSAAAYALRGKSRIRLFMLSPKGRMSEFQQRQMYTLQDKNIHNLCVSGTFDDCQDIVKTINGDAGFKRRYSIGAVNSINWARIAAQVVYFVAGYLRATSNNNEHVTFVIPSGNFGNAHAAYVAFRMGLPISIVVATNSNDVLHRFFRSGGVYSPKEQPRAVETLSPSMDITTASNLERLMFEGVDRDGARIRKLWKQLRETGSFDARETSPNRGRLLRSYMATDSETLRSIRFVYKRFNIVVDPHTAVGFRAAYHYHREGEKMLIAETAQPAKFASTIYRSIEEQPAVPPGYADLLDRPQRYVLVSNDAAEVREYIERKTHA